ncbi:hypothetical protein G7Z17_g1658 [Cylindrodendrum hubeiense]|uniref:Subtilisin n=1 Tax=Cylindrodendrum hubeiense TaxID=595255 RepID=A0A9P5HJ91_9HYPO|nr:hypothetical protein G7Z17_g1658 [Cylindrodendrum hubeiense]
MSLNDILEWRIISALRSYLILPLTVTEEGFEDLDADTISLENARDVFQYELTKIFIWPETSLDIGPSGPAFNLPSDASVAENLETVLDFNRVVDSAPVSQENNPNLIVDPKPTTSVESEDDYIRNYATSAFDTVFSYLEQCQTAHKLMLYLPRQHGDTGSPTSKALLDLFISVCDDDLAWQGTQCGECEAKPPTLLFLGKLLLEIDLGWSLDDDVDKIREDPRENMWTLLSSTFEMNKGDLHYGNAIAACLKFHKERKIRFEMGEITGNLDEWSEWDRSYVRDLVKRLEVPAYSPQSKPEALKKSANAGSTKVLRPSRSPFSRRSGNPAGFSNCQATGSRHTASALPTALASPAPFSSSCTTTVKSGSISSTLTATTTVKPKKSLPVQKQEATSVPISRRLSIISNLQVSSWLESTDTSVQKPAETDSKPLDPRPEDQNEKEDQEEVHREEEDQEEEDVGMFFDEDEMEHSQLSGEDEKRALWAETYFEAMKKFYKKHPLLRSLTGSLETSTQSERNRNIKIAVIDTGVDVSDSDPLIYAESEKGRITGRGWANPDDPSDFHDTCGHGTHLVRLILKVNKTADIIMAKVSEDKRLTQKSAEYIAEAIRWAVEQNADVISLSLGFKKRIGIIDSALETALSPRKGRPRLVFAAAANWGLNYALAFPASREGVFCVHAVNGKGFDAKLSPKPDSDSRSHAIGTLGVAIESQWGGKRLWLTGTSYATPIAAAMTANMLVYARQNMQQDEDSKGDSDSFTYLAPWHMEMNARLVNKTILDAIRARIDFDVKKSYDTTVKLGNVIYSVKRPDMVLFRPDKSTPLLPLGELPAPRTIKNYNIEKGTVKSSKYGFFAKVLEFFGIGANFSRSAGTDVSERYEIKSVAFHAFEPSSEFLAGLQAQKSIMDILKDGSDPVAFLIVGIAVATGVVFKSSDIKDGENEASLGINASGVSIGPMGKRSKNMTLKIDWEIEDPTVLAFKVQKLQLKDDKLVATDEEDGAYFSDDDEPVNYEVDFDAELNDNDLSGLEAEKIQDDFTGEEYNLYLPAE